MEHANSHSQAISTEKKFRELIKEADDFFKIELLRQANNRYKRALKFNIETDVVNSRISECEKMLTFERKVTYILISISAVLALIYLVIFK